MVGYFLSLFWNGMRTVDNKITRSSLRKTESTPSKNTDIPCLFTVPAQGAYIHPSRRNSLRVILLLLSDSVSIGSRVSPQITPEKHTSKTTLLQCKYQLKSSFKERNIWSCSLNAALKF